MKTFTAGQNDNGMRLSRFVQKNTWNLPGALMYKSFRNKRIKVNGRAAPPDLRLKIDDEVELYLNDEFFPEGAGGPAAGETQPLPGADWAVVAEDERFAILYKAAGALSHRDESGQPNLLDSYTQCLIRQGGFAPAHNNAFAPALCNRLDRGTEGLVIAAKQYNALQAMAGLIRDRLVDKDYLCITCGAPPEGEHAAFHRRDRGARTVRVQPQPFEGGKEIRTGVKVLERSGGLALCRVRLFTGRTHQIRAHLALLGTPILGDKKYAGDKARPYPGRGFALCASSLHFSGAIPVENLFCDLAGRDFQAEMAALPRIWARLKGQGI